MGDVAHHDETVQQLRKRAGGEHAVDEAGVSARLVQAARPLAEDLFSFGEVLAGLHQVAPGFVDLAQDGVQDGILGGEGSLRGRDP